MSAHAAMGWQRILLITAVAIGGAVLGLSPAPATAAETLPLGVTERQTCGSETVDVRAYGAGLLYQTNPITVDSVQVSHVDAQDSCAIVEWMTSVPATAQVIFTKAASEPVEVDLSTAFLGYEHGTPQSNDGTAEHRAVLTDLESGATYSYRIVTRSHPSAPPQVSEARTITIAAQQENPPMQPTPTPAPPSTQNENRNPIPPRNEAVGPTLPTPSVSRSSGEQPTSTSAHSDESEPAGAEGAGNDQDTSTVPSAANAVDSAMGNGRGESFWSDIREWFSSLFSGGIFTTGTPGGGNTAHYAIPAVFFLLLLFLAQQLVLPRLGMTVKSGKLYWLGGLALFILLSAFLGLTYLSFAAVVAFLALLAWYLLTTASQDTRTQLLPLPTSTRKKSDAESSSHTS